MKKGAWHHHIHNNVVVDKNMIEANILKHWIINCFLTEHERLRMDIRGDAVIRMWAIFLFDLLCVGSGNVTECWCQVFPDAYKVGALPWIVRKLSCWALFSAQFMNFWQRTNFVCMRKHLTSMFNHTSKVNTKTIKQT